MVDWGNATAEQRREMVREQAATGESASRAAAKLGASRSAVLGVAARAKPPIKFYGSSHRDDRSKTTRVVNKSRQLTPPKPLVEPPPPTRAPEPAGTILTLKPGVCHFPMFSAEEIAATVTPSALPYCCAPTGAREKTYCGFHHPHVWQTKPKTGAVTLPD